MSLISFFLRQAKGVQAEVLAGSFVPLAHEGDGGQAGERGQDRLQPLLWDIWDRQPYPIL